MFAISEVALDAAAQMARRKLAPGTTPYVELPLNDQAGYREHARAILWAALQVDHPLHTEDCQHG